MTSTAYPFWLGGLSASMAACITHPVDQTKYRMQVLERPMGMSKAMSTFVSRDGVLSLWRGLTASILRQSTYSTARFALYGWATSFVKRSNAGGKLAFWQVIGCSSGAGALAGLIGNPAEIVLVRMCADGAKAPETRYNYRNAFQGLYRVATEEGARALYRGLTPNVVRSALMNAAQIATYDGAKRNILASPLKMKDGTPVHLAASIAAGTVATTVCAPADVLKSRIQSAAGGMGLVGVISHGLKTEGLGFLFKGWLPAWLRLGPNTILMFIFMEQLQSAVDTYRARQVVKRQDTVSLRPIPDAGPEPRGIPNILGPPLEESRLAFRSPRE